MIANIYFALIVAGPIDGPGQIHSIWPNKSSCIHVMETMDPKEIGGCVPVTIDNAEQASDQLKSLYQLLYAEKEN